MPVAVGDTVAQQNLHHILDAVRGEGHLSRREVARRTGLSTPTITRHVNELLEAGVLRVSANGAAEPPKPGRPAQGLSLAPDYGTLVGVDVGEHVVRIAAADFAGRVLSTCKVPAHATAGRDASIGALTQAIRDTLDGACDAATDPARPLVAVVGVAGIVANEDGTVIDAPNFTGWRDLRLAEHVSAALGPSGPDPGDGPLRHVRVENDVNLAAVGEAARGVGIGHDDFVFVSVRRGIGAGVFVGGRLLRGHAGMAGELGFMALRPDFDRHLAGGLGHLETVAGEQALLERAGPAPSGPSLRDLCTAAAAGDETDLALLDEALETYGVAVANITSLLDPSLVVIGGDLMPIGAHAVDRIRGVVHRLVPHAPALHCSVLGEDAALQGALHQAHLDACAAVPRTLRPA